MKKILLLTILFFMGLIVQAQTTETINIDWGIGSTPSLDEEDTQYPSKTIEVGDTVIWTWVDNLGHNVASIDGSSTENFDSGIQSGQGQTFSYTFTTEGTNDYRCDPHPSSMFGTITVVADGSLGIDGVENLINTTIYPTHVSSVLHIQLPKLQNELTLEIFNILGERIIKKTYSNSENLEIGVGDLSAGMYILKLVNNNSNVTKRFIKK